MLKFRNSVFVLSLMVFLVVVPYTQAQDKDKETQHEEYSESALRRFEIITLSSLPFTAIHSYLGVRGVRMIQTNKIAPVLSPKNYRVMGICAVSFSLFIGIWDWFHTRNVDRSAPSVPIRKPPTEPIEEEPIDGSIARIKDFGPHANVYGVSTPIRQTHYSLVNTQLNMWASEQFDGLVIPLFQLRF